MTRAHPLRYSGTEIAVAPTPRSSPDFVSESKLSPEVDSAWTAIANSRLAAVGGLHGCRAPTPVNGDARALVERQLHGALAAVVALRRRQNALTLAATLPSELLALIFLSLASMRRLSRTSTFQASWISVTHVCSSWRSAALTYARLWTDLPLDVGKSWAEQFVTRSKSLPIQVLAYLPASLLLKRSPLAVLAETSRRIAILSLKGSAPHIQTALELLRFCSLDGLQSLALEPEGYIYGNAIPVILKSADRLETLSLSRTSIAWTSIHWAKIRSFSCSNLPPNVPSNDMLLSLISALNQATRLEDLHLELSSCRFALSTLSHGSACLESLKAFAISGFAAECESILRHVNIPSTASLSVHMVSDNRMRAFARSIIPLIREHSAIESPSPHIKLEPLRLNASDRGSQLSLKAGEHAASNGSSTYHIDISLRGAGVSHAELATLCENFSMKYLLSLEVMLDDSSPWDLAVWHRLFKSAERVRTISASGPSAMALCSALIEPFPCSSSKQSSSSDDDVNGSSTSSDSDDHTLLFPLLSDLHLLRIHGEGQGEEMYDVAMWIEDRDSLAPISKLQISDCTLSEDCVDMLEDIDGLEMVWDGSYGRFYEDEEEWLGCGCCEHGHGGCSSDEYMS